MLTSIVIPPPSKGVPEHSLRTAFKRCRHQIYCRLLGYEPENESGIEEDEFDDSATYLLVVENGCVVGGCRMIPFFPTGPFSRPVPLTREYQGSLWQPSYEISRCVNMIQPTTLHDKRPARVTDKLYELVCDFLESQDVGHAYAVVEPRFARKLGRDYSLQAFAPLCAPYKVHTPAGVRLTHVALHISTKDLREAIQSRDAQEEHISSVPLAA